MAFVNEHMTNRERVEFVAKAIQTPPNALSTLKPSKWTIDRQKNAFLVMGLQEREMPHENYFVFVWKNKPIPVKLSKSWVDRDTCKWGLINAKIPEDLKKNQNEIFQSLKDALSVYGFSGTPDNPLNYVIKVQFSF